MKKKHKKKNIMPFGQDVASIDYPKSHFIFKPENIF